MIMNMVSLLDIINLTWECSWGPDSQKDSYREASPTSDKKDYFFAATSATYTLLKSGSIAISSFLYSFFIIITNFRRLSIGSKNGKCFRTFPHCIFKPSAYHALGFWVPFSVFYVRHSVIPSHFWNCIMKYFF